MQTKKECYVCKNPNVHLHHIYYGTANRKKSDEYGCTVWLCAMHHNMSDHGVHFNKPLDLMLKRKCQVEFEKTHTRAEFRAIFGKSWL